MADNERTEQRNATDDADFTESKLSAEQRRKLPASDFGDPEGRRFPIVDQDDVDSAAHLIGKAGDPAAVKRRITAIARRKGLSLPDAWKGDDATLTEGATTFRVDPHDPRYAAVQTDDGARASRAHLTEATQNVVRRVDRTHRDVEVRIISPGLGNSRHKGLPVYYTERALEKGAGLFKGRKCFLDHPTAADRQNRPERSIKDWAATMREAWWDAGSKEVRGIMRAYDPWLIDRVEAAPDEVALSIDASGKASPGTVNGQRAAIVESIDHAGSVDIVTYAGARGGVVRLLEGAHAPRDAGAAFTEAEQREVHAEMLEDISLEEARRAHPEWFPAAPDHSAELTQLRETLTTLQEQDKAREERTYLLERELNVRDTTALVERAAATVEGLPAAARARVVTQFREATCGFGASATFADEAQLAEAVTSAAQAELDYIKSVTAATAQPASGGKPSVITGMGPGADAQTPATRATFAESMAEKQARLDKALGVSQAAPASGNGNGDNKDRQAKIDALMGV